MNIRKIDKEGKVGNKHWQFVLQNMHLDFQRLTKVEGSILREEGWPESLLSKGDLKIDIGKDSHRTTGVLRAVRKIGRAEAIVGVARRGNKGGLPAGWEQRRGSIGGKGEPQGLKERRGRNERQKQSERGPFALRSMRKPASVGALRGVTSSSIPDQSRRSWSVSTHRRRRSEKMLTPSRR